MVISQGDIFWIEFDEPVGSEPGYRHPHVVVQNNLFNQSRINTVVVCPLTSVNKRSGAPGNVLLNKGEANLPKECIVKVSQIITVDKEQLEECIGTLSLRRVSEILTGIKLVLDQRDPQ